MLWDTFENRFSLPWGFMFVLLCSFTKKETGSVFPTFYICTEGGENTASSTLLWSHAVMYPEWGTILFAQMYHDRDTFDFSQDHVTKINHWQSLFSWVKV